MRGSHSRTAAALTISAAVLVVGTMAGTTAQQPPATPQTQQSTAQAPSGRGGGRGGIAPLVFTAADVDKNGVVTREELRTTFVKWFSDADSGGTGLLTEDQLVAGLTTALPQPAPPAAQADPCGGRSAQPQVPCPEHVQAMLAALPDIAPAKPKQPRKVLVLARAAGFVHSSIPLAARTVEELGKKTGAWSTTVSYDAAVINPDNLKQFDAIFLNSTTGRFLDDPNDAAATAMRKKALMDFVRSGKGLAAIHAASDSYHGDPNPAPPGGRGGGRGSGAAGTLGSQMLAQGDKNNDQKLSRDEIAALADAWFDKVDTEKAGTLSAQSFSQRFATSILPQPQPPAAGGRGTQPAPVNEPLWPEFNKMIGGYFKHHWNDPQLITVKIDDPKSPINAAFKGQPFEIRDETYTFAQDSFSRQNVHVLTSVDYSKMSEADKAHEPAASRRTDGDYALSWIRREGKGRVFYQAHGHSERVYAIKPMLEQLLAGIQYALGDLPADDSPSVKGEPGKTQNSELRTQNSELRTQNVEFRISSF